HMRSRIPDYMVPNAFVFLDALPLNGNGKIDRGRLPAADTERAHAARTAPRTATEHALAEIWREVLDVPDVASDDSFFDLGGHSMLAVRIVSRLRARFGIDLSIAALFHAPTVAGLAELVDARAGRTVPRSDPSATREVIEL